MSELPPPPPPSNRWTAFLSHRDHGGILVEDIAHYEFSDGVWFFVGESGKVTAVPVNRYEWVALTPCE